jgi:hypothetical protein
MSLERNWVRNPATTSTATTNHQIKKQKLLPLPTMLVMVIHNPATTSTATTKHQIKKQKLLPLPTMLVMVRNRHLLHPPTRAVKPLYMPTGTQLRNY